MAKIAFETSGPYPIDDRRGKGFEFKYVDHRSKATVTVFVHQNDAATARDIAIEAARAASDAFAKQGS